MLYVYVDWLRAIGTRLYVRLNGSWPGQDATNRHTVTASAMNELQFYALRTFLAAVHLHRITVTLRSPTFQD
jgi:hypothetical protein